MSALMEYGVIDELFNLLYSYDEMTLEVVVIIMRKILEEFLENSENRNMILQKFEEFETVQRLQELRMSPFNGVAGNAYCVLEIFWEKIKIKDNFSLNIF